MQSSSEHKHFGIYEGKVKSIGDEKQIGRIRATVPAIFGDHSSVCAWAAPSPAMAGAGGGYGFFALPQINDMVYIQFVDGDLDSPIWSHGPWHIRDGESGAPRHAWGERDECDAGMKGAHDIPKSPFRGEYGKVYIWQTPGGHLIEMDDTDGYERLQIYHSSGSHYEMMADGTIVDASTNNRVVVTTGKKKETVRGDSLLHVQGNHEESFYGNYSQTILGDAKFVWKGEVSNELGKINWKTGGDQRFESGGDMYHYADANAITEVGGSRSAVVTASDSQFVMGPMTVMVANTENVDPTADSMLMHGMNGVTSMVGTDPTGLASGGYTRIEVAPPVQKLYAGPAPEPVTQIAGVGSSQGSGLVLDGTGAGTILHSMLNMIIKGMALAMIDAPMVQVGGPAAIHPVLWGEVAALLFDSHTHSTAVGPSGPPVAPVMAATAVSKQVKSA